MITTNSSTYISSRFSSRSLRMFDLKRIDVCRSSSCFIFLSISLLSKKNLKKVTQKYSQTSKSTHSICEGTEQASL